MGKFNPLTFNSETDSHAPSVWFGFAASAEMKCKKKKNQQDGMKKLKKFIDPHVKTG